MPNRLIHSKSPYLLQHAHNPVDWFPWGEEALTKAESENKPILVSIGYSSCHWCHVMERESFEDAAVAEMMNAKFVCIKIDREERPDLDNIYMEAVQVMGLQGGWPLNVFLMPNQKPFYGGTYFPKKNWIQVLGSISQAFVDQHEQLSESAEGFGRSLSRETIEKYGLKEEKEGLSKAELLKIGESIIRGFDPEWGGLKRAPKFPMPAIWAFLLDLAILNEDPDLGAKVLFTLKKIGMGGIYDHIGGGFARYSVDSEWFAPHFEKMLYDNGQLLSLYAKAYQYSKDDFYKEKLDETVTWLEREMTDGEGGFYAALDADSEGEEGKYYTWTHEELAAHLAEERDWFCDLYTVKREGNWESGRNILFQTASYDENARQSGLKPEELKARLAGLKTRLLAVRENRIKPGLDDKIISGWNGLTISGLSQVYKATGNMKALDMARKCGEFIWSEMVVDGRLYRNYKHGEAYTPAFLEDYAAVIQAFLDLYGTDFDGAWLQKAKLLTEGALQRYLDRTDHLFYFNDPGAEKLIANKKELFDNVIPSSNSMMARNLHQLGLYYYHEPFQKQAKKMLGLLHGILIKEPGFMANWASLYLEQLVPTAEIAVVGKGAKQKALGLHRFYHPNSVIAASDTTDKEIPLLSDKTENKDGEALIYVCFNKTCQRPVTAIEEALPQLPKL
jgi:uncharacterized protein YyaL (SSP411 family)